MNQMLYCCFRTTFVGKKSAQCKKSRLTRMRHQFSKNYTILPLTIKKKSLINMFKQQ